MKNLAENVTLIVANVGAWAITDLTEIERILKVLLLVLSIIIALKKLLIRKQKDSDLGL